MKYLVIVESPAKTNKILGFLKTISGHEFIVDASFGHIRYFKNGLKSIDIGDNFKPTYGNIKTKLKVIAKLKKLAKQVDEVIIATDRDREGEAIGYHLIKVLNLSCNNTKRICFNEITKNAIISAFNSPITLNMDMFYAQQARSILDLLIGFKLSPLLWANIQPKLSAGRCQSPALKLVYERNKLINDFVSNKSFEVTGNFKIPFSESSFLEQKCNYSTQLKDIEKTKEKISNLIKYGYKLSLDKVKNTKFNPPPPYITSTIQQDASSKFGMSPKSTMQNLQKLYEAGKITYMRTDSIAISEEFKKTCKDYINYNFKGKFTSRKYKSKSANAQEAHECIRPVNIAIKTSDIGDSYQRKLYDIIWKRTLACFMPMYKEDVYKYKLPAVKIQENYNNCDNLIKPEKQDYFTFELKKTIDIGYRVLYNDKIEDNSETIDKIVINKDLLEPENIVALEKNTKPKGRYTEASLVKELEKLGIGRPSTFSNIVNTLLERKYVVKEAKDTRKDILLQKFIINKNNEIVEQQHKSKSPSQKGKLFITQIGNMVNEYMTSNFENINSYNFTSEINDKLDQISNGNMVWYNLVNEVYISFIDKVNQLSSQESIIKTKEFIINKKKLIGEKDTFKYYAYRDKYGVNILKQKDDEILKKFRVSNSLNLKDITMDIIETYCKYPINKGKYKNSDVLLKKGPYGLYCEINDKKVKVEDENISLDKIIQLLEKKNNNIIKEWKQLKILKGPYGPYIRKGTKNIPIPKDKDPLKLKKKDCEEIVKKFKPKKRYNKKK